VASGPAVEGVGVLAGLAELDWPGDIGVMPASALLFPHVKLRQKLLVARLLEPATHSFFHSSHSRDGRVCW
jgi:hypothetical protein